MWWLGVDGKAESRSESRHIPSESKQLHIHPCIHTYACMYPRLACNCSSENRSAKSLWRYIEKFNYM